MSTMDRIEIVPYAAGDSSDAIALEATLDQGEAIALRFRRPTFHARSSVYEKPVILCAKSDGRLVGIAAGALKTVGLNGEVRRAVYGYDLRVDPAFRRGGTAQRLGNAVIESLGGGDCRYSLVAGQNRLAVRFTQRAFGAACTIPLVYVIIPVMRSRRRRPACVDPGAEGIHQEFLRHAGPLDMLPPFRADLLAGHVCSVRLEGGSAGCSIWTNESLLAEEVVRLPRHLQLLGLVARPLANARLLPRIPRQGEMVRSWFLHDLFARGVQETRELLTEVSARALESGKDFVYVLMQEGDPTIKAFREAGYRYLTLPYVFVAGGTNVPAPGSRIYLDVRDI